MPQYRYFFRMFMYYLAVHLCDSTPSSGLLVDSNDITHNQSSTKQYCEIFLTYNKMARLLSRNTCQTFDIPKANQNNHPRNKRQVHAGDFDIKAIQTTVNDHRTMIEYLFNNSINETILANALYDHSRTTPSITSWRDLIDIVCIGLLLTILL